MNLGYWASPNAHIFFLIFKPNAHIIFKKSHTQFENRHVDLDVYLSDVIYWKESMDQIYFPDICY